MSKRERRLNVRKVRMPMRPIPCTACGRVSNPLSLYRAFFVPGWYHAGCYRQADGDYAVRILLGAMFK